MYNPKQGDIVFLDFSPQSGHEQAGRRPGVVISNEQFFIRTKFAVVCPITNTSNKFPLHIPLDNRTKTILLNQGHNHKAMALHFFIYNLFFL